MSPSAESNVPAAALQRQAELLQEGEQIIFAMKPSSWFVLIVSWPVLMFLLLVAAVTFAAEGLIVDLQRQTVMLLCLAGVCIRVMVGCFQWVSHLYVLTNLRVLHVRGLTRTDVLESPLKSLREVPLSCTFLERCFGLASLQFLTANSDRPPIVWTNLARPLEVQKAVQEAIKKAR